MKRNTSTKLAAALLKASTFAARKHRNQRRKDAEASPYINHPIEVAEILARIGGVDDVAVLQAALLHDTVEDTQTSPDYFRRAGHYGAGRPRDDLPAEHQLAGRIAGRREATVKLAFVQWPQNWFARLGPQHGRLGHTGAAAPTKSSPRL